MAHLADVGSVASQRRSAAGWSGIDASPTDCSLQLAVLDRAIADCTESRRLSEKAFSFRSFPSWSRRGCRSSAARARLFIYISRHFRAQSVRNPYSRISGIRESHEGFIRFDAAARRRNA